MFKVKNELSPGIICDIFIQRINNHYNLRNINFWDIVPEEYEKLNSLNIFKESKKKKKKKKWVPLNYPCRLCKTYVHGVGSLEGL